ncbi:MAG: hypothetical protein AAB347_13960, partial [Bacteroidota bacterium]
MRKGSSPHKSHFILFTLSFILTLASEPSFEISFAPAVVFVVSIIADQKGDGLLGWFAAKSRLFGSVQTKFFLVGIHLAEFS